MDTYTEPNHLPQTLDSNLAGYHPQANPAYSKELFENKEEKEAGERRVVTKA